MLSNSPEKENESQLSNWHVLKQLTNARVALGRTGTSIPLQECLALKMAHAHAKDAVYSTLDLDSIYSGLEGLELPYLLLQSQATTRNEYLQRPDLGRRLNTVSAGKLESLSLQPFDVVIVLADGLSANAINRQALPLMKLLVPALAKGSYTLAPITVVQQARVAIADEIGQMLRGKLSLILIGERPGLSSTESMSAYLTYSPALGLSDESRNCVSNIQPNGLNFSDACAKILYLVHEALRKRLSGVMLKEETRRLI